MKDRLLIFTLLLVMLSACTGKKAQEAPKPTEDQKAKQMLQGIWVNDDEQTVAFRAKGDTIYYADSTSQPVYFQIFGDTLVLHGVNDVRYPILRQAPHLF